MLDKEIEIFINFNVFRMLTCCVASSKEGGGGAFFLPPKMRFMKGSL